MGKKEIFESVGGPRGGMGSKISFPFFLKAVYPVSLKGGDLYV